MSSCSCSASSSSHSAAACFSRSSGMESVASGLDGVLDALLGGIGELAIVGVEEPGMTRGQLLRTSQNGLSEFFNRVTA
jgi:hypothetical protein